MINIINCITNNKLETLHKNNKSIAKRIISINGKIYHKNDRGDKNKIN